MGTSRTIRRRSKAAPARSRWNLPILAGIAVAVGLAAAGSWWWSQDRASDPLARYQTLQGRWQRGDGGYVIDISGVDGAGTLKAAYFNPRPIKVSKAEASIAGESLRVFIELRDVNYPGSTYQLTYDPAADRLTGTYYQAALRESYDVEFGRLKPSDAEVR